MNEFAPDVYYVVGFEGGAGDDDPVTMGSVALVRNGKLINAGLDHSREYPGPVEELEEFIREGSVTRVEPHPIPNHLGDSPCYVLRVRTGGAVGGFIQAFSDKRYMTTWSETAGWTYYLYSSFEECDVACERIAEGLLDWANLPGIDRETQKAADEAARVLDHRISTYELVMSLDGNIDDMPERNRAPERLRAKILKRPE